MAPRKYRLELSQAPQTWRARLIPLERESTPPDVQAETAPPENVNPLEWAEFDSPLALLEWLERDLPLDTNFLGLR